MLGTQKEIATSSSRFIFAAAAGVTIATILLASETVRSMLVISLLKCYGRPASEGIISTERPHTHSRLQHRLRTAFPQGLQR